MTYDEAESIVKSIDTKMSPIKIDLFVSKPFYIKEGERVPININEYIELITRIHVLDIKTKEPIKAMTRNKIHVEPLITKGQLIMIVWENVKFMVVHELTECFMVDGKQWQDPHINDRVL